MPPSISNAIAQLSSPEIALRIIAAAEIYHVGVELVDTTRRNWLANTKLSALLLHAEPQITVGIAVEPSTFARIREANDAPQLAQVPPDQDAEEFELHFPTDIFLDILTTREPGGTGAIAKYLAKFREGIQQVEFRCADVDRATEILREDFALTPVYPQTRAGADGTLINFFLTPAPNGGKVLIELWQHHP